VNDKWIVRLMRALEWGLVLATVVSVFVHFMPHPVAVYAPKRDAGAGELGLLKCHWG